MALGAGALRSPRKQKDDWVAAGMACDVADVGAGVLAGARGQLPLAAAALVTATAAFFALAAPGCCSSSAGLRPGRNEGPR